MQIVLCDLYYFSFISKMVVLLNLQFPSRLMDNYEYR